MDFFCFGTGEFFRTSSVEIFYGDVRVQKKSEFFCHLELAVSEAGQMPLYSASHFSKLGANISEHIY